MNWLTEGFQEIDLVLTNPNYKTTLNLHENTAEFEYLIARGELERNGNLIHGMNHLAQLLTYDPSDPEWLDLLEKYLARAVENPERLLSEESRNYYAIEAVRAYIYAKQNKFEKALKILDAISQGKPDALYMETWGIDWLSQPGVMESNIYCSWYVLAKALNRFGELCDLTHSRQKYALQYAELTERYLKLRKLQKINDEKSDLLIKMTYVGFLRKAGCFREALNQAKINYRDNPNWHSSTAVGLVLREMKQTEAAEKYFRQALKYDPADVSIKLDMADMYLALGNWHKAKKIY